MVNIITPAILWLAAEHHKKEVELFRHLGLHNPWADDGKKAEWPLVAESGQLLLNRYVWMLAALFTARDPCHPGDVCVGMLWALTTVLLGMCYGPGEASPAI